MCVCLCICVSPRALNFTETTLFRLNLDESSGESVILKQSNFPPEQPELSAERV